MRIGYDEECGSVIIVGRDVFPACTLRATMEPDGKVRVRSLAETCELYCDWFRLQDLDGRFFDTPEDAKAYLDGVLLRRPLAEAVPGLGVAAMNMPAGLPVSVSRATGQMQAARADTYAAAFVVGLMAEPVVGGFAGPVTRGTVTLADWSAVAGAARLAAGRPYFLGPTGGLIPEPVTAPGLCLVRVGMAVGPLALTVNPIDPVLL